VALAGELGTGKTTFVRGAARRLGVDGPVTSPTYTLAHRYEGRLPVAHLDLYRVERLTADDWGALEPYLAGAVAFVEWPERSGGWLPPARVSARLSHVDPTHRRIQLSSKEAGLLAGLP
jgi:tRNA threonylcarbamoyladenosine biosynthesis protein TsaE